MGEQGRPGPLRRMLRALAGEAEDARRAAIERTSAKYPEAYSGRQADREREQPDQA